MRRLQILQKLVHEKFYIHEKNLRTRNCRRKFIKNLLPEKRKENVSTTQSRFQSRLKDKACKTLKYFQIFLDLETDNLCPFNNNE